MDYDAVTSYAIMNQLCKVCGEPAAGFHFGAFTCEGCKSFFGRTYNNISSISECKNNGKCVINKKNRTACKACRLRKCVMVGMSKSGSRYGRRSNWFKIHCLLQQQQQTDVNMAAAANLLRPNPYLTPIFRNPSVADHHQASVRENSGRSSESDSGASSADPEDSAFSYLRPSASPSSDRVSDSECFGKRRQSMHAPPTVSPASLPAISPGALVPNRWLPPFQGIADPAAWREFFLRGPPQMAAPAPGQDQPIDLSVKNRTNKDEVREHNNNNNNNSEKELSVDVGMDERIGKTAVPLDLTLER